MAAPRSADELAEEVSNLLQRSGALPAADIQQAVGASTRDLNHVLFTSDRFKDVSCEGDPDSLWVKTGEHGVPYPFDEIEELTCSLSDLSDKRCYAYIPNGDSQLPFPHDWVISLESLTGSRAQRLALLCKLVDGAGDVDGLVVEGPLPLSPLKHALIMHHRLLGLPVHILCRG